MELDGVLMEFGLKDYERSMDQLFPRNTFSFEELWREVTDGDVIDVFVSLIGKNLEWQLNGWNGLKNIFLTLLILGLISAILTNFVDIFDRAQVADLSFYFLYLSVSAILIRCFFEISQVASEALDNIVLFVKLLIPTYLVAVGVSSGAATVTMYYEIVILMIYGVEHLLTRLVIPLSGCYMMLSVINGFWPKEKLGLIAELIKKGIQGTLKAGVGIITGLGVIQAMITPSLDSFRSTAIKKAVAAVPGVGDAARGIMDITLASAITVKNSIGVVLMILLAVLCLGPLCKILLVSLVLKISAAFMGIVSDKRITVCTDQAAETGFLLFKTVAAAMLLFLISLSIVAVSTNRVY